MNSQNHKIRKEIMKTIIKTALIGSITAGLTAFFGTALAAPAGKATNKGGESAVLPAVPTTEVSGKRKDNFLFLNYGSDLVFNKKGVHSTNFSLEYGRYVISADNSYSAFFGVLFKIHLFSVYNTDDPPPRGFFTEVKWGWEFMRDSAWSFGLDTSHGTGILLEGILPALALTNALGVFGKFRGWRNHFSVVTRIGVSHHNAIKKIDEIYKSNNFGPYLHLGLQYHY